MRHNICSKLPISLDRLECAIALGVFLKPLRKEPRKRRRVWLDKFTFIVLVQLLAKRYFRIAFSSESALKDPLALSIRILASVYRVSPIDRTRRELAFENRTDH